MRGIGVRQSGKLRPCPSLFIQGQFPGLKKLPFLLERRDSPGPSSSSSKGLLGSLEFFKAGFDSSIGKGHFFIIRESDRFGMDFRADLNRQMGGPAAGKIADRQVHLHLPGVDQGSWGPWMMAFISGTRNSSTRKDPLEILGPEPGRAGSDGAAR